ncbi:MAG: nicotinate (nicotinamide) nucleotide adenylyltransferase [Candidatus Ancillula sp.]|jgi:PncC family amidohydrolase|nr:nicotinate (nicotinamide) nucleotide adenylyltransferase [Candidatus Ancillula sp.]
MKIGIFGGTFDPIHIGHLVSARSVLCQAELSKILFTPNNLPIKFRKESQPQTKTNTEWNSQRLIQIHNLIKNNPFFELSTVDLDRAKNADNQITYSIDTVNDIKKLYPDDELFFIIGADQFKHLHQWKEVDKLLELTHFLVTNRGGITDVINPKIPKDKYSIIEIPNIEISSTELRNYDFTISTAESLTGGMLASRIVDRPGASRYYKGGVITYTNEEKIEQLGISPKIIDKYGVISPEIAKLMAEQVAQKFKTDFAISTTGVAGPDPVIECNKKKPVGLVYIGLYVRGFTFAQKVLFPKMRHEREFTRNEIRLATVLKIRDLFPTLFN